MIYLKLLWSFCQIGLFSIGGGYAAMPLLQTQIVDVRHWMTMSEFVNIITISQMTPGPIAINAATFIGMRIAGLPGALVATAGCVLPSFLIVLTVAYFFYKHRDIWVIQGLLTGLRPAVVSLIATAGLSILLMAITGGAATQWQALGISNLDVAACILFAAGFIVLRKFKLNPILIMLGSGVIGFVLYDLIGLSGIV